MAPKTFSNESLSRCDQFYQIFVQIGANLAIFQPFEISIFFSKLRTPVCPSKSAPIGLKLCQNAFQTIPDVSFFDAEKKISAKFSDRKISFSMFWLGFSGATAKRTSKSDSASNFAPDTAFLRSVRLKIMKIDNQAGHARPLHDQHGVMQVLA